MNTIWTYALTALQGLNTKKGFDVKVAAEISNLTGYEFKTAPNKVIIMLESIKQV